jgi:hypothetical protein
MWIFTKHGFYSVVEDRDNADLLLVRARVEGDIEKYFRDAVVYYTPEHDYAYRAHVSRREVAAVRHRPCWASITQTLSPVLPTTGVVVSMFKSGTFFGTCSAL